MKPFRSNLGETVFNAKYRQHRDETWPIRAAKIVDDVCGTRGGTEAPLLPMSMREELVRLITEFKFLPGGRYIYYAGRQASFFNNCFLLRAEEDTREEWAAVAQRATSCLMTGGGIGIDYSLLRERGRTLSRTGGTSSGPIPLMKIINEIGRNVMQGGSRRSAVYASLNWQHLDVGEFLRVKNWHDQYVPGTQITIAQAKNADFNYPAALDMTNISLNYDDAFLNAITDEHGNFDATGIPETFFENARQALMTGEPGFSFNFGTDQNETLRNACCEITSEDDSDVCNLGSINMGAIENLCEFEDAVQLGTAFLICGTIRGELPYEKVYDIRAKNRRLGLGLMGVHEWLLRRNYRYEMTPELRLWMESYRDISRTTANGFSDNIGISRPIKVRAIAPTGTIGMLAGTTTGIEPVFAVAYRRRYLTNGTVWKEQYAIDSTAKHLIEKYGLDPNSIESAADLAADPVRRITFQADMQDYVDHAISSTINLPAWGTPLNNESTVHGFAVALARLAPRLRGFTCYPDGARGGQPITAWDYEDAKTKEGIVFDANDICDITGKGGSCGV